MNDKLTEMLNFVLMGGKASKNITEILGMDLTETTAWGTVVDIYGKAIVPIGMALLSLYFLIELITKTSEDRFSLETIIRMLLKMAFAYVLISNGETIMKVVVQFGAAVAQDIQKGLSAVESTGITSTYKPKFWDFVILLFPWIISYVVQIIIQLTCWSRNIELLVRVMFAPIALSDVYTGGATPHAIRYIKKTLSVALRGGVLIAVAIIGGLLSSLMSNVNTIDTLDLSTLISILVVQFTIAGMCGAAGTIADDIVGVH